MATATHPPPSSSDTSMHPLIDKKTARKAIAKRAVSLRKIMEDESNTEVFIKAGLLLDEHTDVIKDLQANISQNPALFPLLIAVVSQLPSDITDVSPTEEVKKLQGLSLLLLNHNNKLVVTSSLKLIINFLNRNLSL